MRNDILGKVIEFMEHHAISPMKEIEKPLKSADLSELVDSWYSDFVNIEQDTLFDILLAANYMDVHPLLDLCSAKVASMIKGKTAEQIREDFGIVNDFTPEEEEAVVAENRWIE